MKEKIDTLLKNLTHKTLVLSPVYRHLKAVELCFTSMMAALEAREDLIWIIIDSGSTPDIQAYINTLSHPRLGIQHYPSNIGKPNSINHLLKTYLSTQNLPQAVVSMDSDITFSVESFSYLIEAATQIPHIGYLSMRYTPNRCNPEKNLILPAKQFKGVNGHIYTIKRPLFCNVAGGLIAIPGTVIEQYLKFELYHDAEGKIRYPDDAKLYDTLKKHHLIMGYLNGAIATHLRSDDITEY